MSNFAIIKNNLVVNTIVAEENVVNHLGIEADHIVLLDDEKMPSLGWHFSENKFYPDSTPEGYTWDEDSWSYIQDES